MTTTGSHQEASSNMTDELSNQLSRQPHEIIKVYIRLMFCRIGEIDTLNEKYQAQASIEARWLAEFDTLSSSLSSDDQKNLVNGKTITLLKYVESHWHPQLYIENALGDLKEQITYSAKKSKHDNQIYICEHRDIKGVFWEKLELQHFPSDVQDLSISVASMLYNDRVVLYADPYLLSGVNLETFVDQQEWSLYKHVDIEERNAAEFLLGDTNEDDDVDEENKHENRKRSILTVTCHAARQSNYFYWNGYCLIFLITLVSFCIFAIPQNLSANRIQISCTLLLTSITFRWTVNRTLPTISYLTSLDTYAIICIFTLVIQSIWHAIIGAIIFYNTPENRLMPTMWFVTLDRYVFYAVIGIFVVMHIFLFTWLYMVPYKHRQNMAKKDKQYQLGMPGKKNNESFTTLLGKSSGFLHIPIEKTV